MFCRYKIILKIDDVDILDETPVIDIKPYVPWLDSYPNERIGWFEGKLEKIQKPHVRTTVANQKFAPPVQTIIFFDIAYALTGLKTGL